MPERVLLQPARLEYGLHQEQYETLLDTLEGQGVLVRLLAPRMTEAIPSFPRGSEFYDLVVHVGEVAGATLGTANLIRLLRRELRDSAQRLPGPRLAKLYLQTGEVHEFDLDREDDQARLVEPN